MSISSLYNKINELLKHLFKPFPILLGIVVSVIEINDYLTPDPIDKVLTQIKESQTSISKLQIVDIPDSLQTDFIKETRILQQRLIGYAKVINSFTFVESEEEFILKMQVSRLKNAVTAIHTASTELREYIFSLPEVKVNEFHAASMCIPDNFMSMSGDVNESFLSLLNEVISDKNNHSNKERLAAFNHAISSDIAQEWIKVNNDMICSAFEYLNVIQISLAYDLKMQFEPMVDFNEN